MMYVQCQLSNQGRVDVSFIPEKFATVGRFLGIKIDGVWENGWKVEQTFNKVHEDAVVEMRDRHLHHRKGTDI